ncbi:MAG: hypothetical protein NC930_01955 [Candidatus Omnitrophica bacterium]|nr:hypothetical protein [Candidatus Omnitrophota bacterium]
MGLEAFPEIESFQKLPRQVIVKGGTSTFSHDQGAELRGIVINNIGHAICDVRVNVVIFDKKKLPVLSTSAATDPDALPQGGIGTFVFQLKNYPQEISDYYLYTNWKFNEKA